MRRTTGPGSITARAVKPLLALAVMLTALATAAPAAVAAAPAPTATAVTSQAPMTGSWNVAPEAGTNGDFRAAADFTCNWFSRYPFQIVDFTCQVRTGVIRVFLICANGARVNSAPLRAVGTYNIRLICPGVRVQTNNWETLA